MSNDLDMKDYAGEVNESAAVVHPVEVNSYQEEANEGLGYDAALAAKAVEEPSKQELNFKALRDEVEKIKERSDAEKREYQLQLDMLKANYERRLSDRQPAKAEPKMFGDMKDDDIANVGELRREWEQKEANYQSRLEELQVAQEHPDYNEIVTKFTVPLVQNKPHLAEGFRGSTNKALFAYELGKMAQQLEMNKATPSFTQKSETAQRIVDNSRKPGTLSQAGGQNTLGKADYYASMSDAEFVKMASKHLEGI